MKGGFGVMVLLAETGDKGQEDHEGEDKFNFLKEVNWGSDHTSGYECQ
jgi:hypothetical protein